MPTPAGRVEVRLARPEDHPRIAALTLAAYRHSGQVPDGRPYQKLLADVAGRAAAGELLVAVEQAGAGPKVQAGAGPKVVGSVLYVRPGSQYAELCGPHEAEFRTLAVDPAAQGAGAGAALVRACLDRAAAHGYRAVVLSSWERATAAHRLYARLGFVRAPERDWTPEPDIHLWAFRRPLSGHPSAARQSSDIRQSGGGLR